MVGQSPFVSVRSATIAGAGRKIKPESVAVRRNPVFFSGAGDLGRRAKIVALGGGGRKVKG